MKQFLLMLIGLCVSAVACAHKASDSYLSMDVRGVDVSLRWDIALRDLELVIGLDRNRDRAIDWGEVRLAKSAINDYAQQRLKVSSAGEPCSFGAADLLVDRHSDGSYAVLRFPLHCSAAISNLQVRYDLLFEEDAQHRGLLRVRYGDQEQAAIFSTHQRQQQLDLRGTPGGYLFLDYLAEGVRHLLTGYDHILFLISLLLPCVWIGRSGERIAVSRFQNAAVAALKVVTAFTLSHSLTLVLTSLGLLSLPSRLVESLIAASVLVTAVNNVYGFLPGKHWHWAAGFGLVHGLGFASVLGALGLPMGLRITALAGFNLGIELGQIAILLLLLPLAYLARHTFFYRRLVFPAGSMLVAVVAGFWLVERALNLQLN